MPPHSADPDRYSRLPTGPTPVRVESGPQLDHEGSAVQDLAWGSVDTGTIAAFPAVPAVRDGSAGSADPAADPAAEEPRLAPWALLSAIVALFASLFVGWGIPVAIISVTAAIMALRRPQESRAASVWALVLGLLATLYSAGWLVWAAYRFGWFG